MTTAPARAAHRLAPLDGLRMLGAAMVVTTHVAFSSGDSVRGLYAGVLARLDAGVAIFFVVSGFLLYRPHARARLGTASPAEAARARDWRSYARHRVLRILPAAWLAVALTFLLHRDPSLGVGPYLRIATQTQVYTPQPSVPGLTQMWSLATEVAFYLVLPVLALGLARLPRRRWHRAALAVLAAGPVLALGWTAATHDLLDGTTNLWLPAYAGWFGAGMALAVWREARLGGELGPGRLDDLLSSPGTVWALAGALYLLLATKVAGPYGLSPATPLEAATKTLGYTILAVLVVAPCVAPQETGSRVVAALGSPLGRTLGDISYGVFCYHLLVLGLLERLLGHEPFSGQGVLLWVATTAVTVPLAWASHRYLEAPIMRWARRKDRRPAPAPGAPAGAASAAPAPARRP